MLLLELIFLAVKRSQVGGVLWLNIHILSELLLHVETGQVGAMEDVTQSNVLLFGVYGLLCVEELAFSLRFTHCGSLSSFCG